MAKRKQNTKQNFEDILSDSLRFHGMLTPSKEEKTDGIIVLPEQLKSADFLFSKETTEKPSLRIAAFKRVKKKK